MKFKKIILTILMIMALGGGLFLIKQNQDVRRGATVNNVSLSIAPASRITKNVGEELTFAVQYSADNGVKVESIQAYVCYGPEIELKTVKANTALGFSPDVLYSTVPGISSDNMSIQCAYITVLSNDTDKTCAVNLAQAGKAFDMVFTAVKVGGPRSITISSLGDKTMATKYATGDADKKLAVKITGGSEYLITGTDTCNRCSKIFDYMRTQWEAVDCTKDPTEGVVVTRTYDESCKAPVDTRDPNQCSRCSKVNDQQYVWWIKQDGKTCNDDPKSDQVIYRAPNKNCRISTGDWPVLNYKVSFGYVYPGASDCAVNWPVQVIVLSGGTTHVYTDVIMQSKKDGDGRVTYEGSLELVDFPYKDGVAVFFKGPKHLQMKYAIQDQSTSYEKAGGELTLTTDPATSPKYDFSKYWMLPGDLVGTDSDVPDGWINGRDFSYVKNHADHTTVEAGEYLFTDLNGDCQANSNDVNVLKKSLEFKQGQLY